MGATATVILVRVFLEANDQFSGTRCWRAQTATLRIPIALLKTHMHYILLAVCVLQDKY